MFLNVTHLWQWVLQSWRQQHLWGTGWCSDRGPAPHVVPPPGKLPSAACGSTVTARTSPAPYRFSADNQTKTTENEISQTPTQPHISLKSIQVIKKGWQAEKQTGRQRRVGISYMGGQDNKYVINVTGNNSVFARESWWHGPPGLLFPAQGLELTSPHLLPC